MAAMIKIIGMPNLIMNCKRATKFSPKVLPAVESKLSVSEAFQSGTVIAAEAAKGLRTTNDIVARPKTDRKNLRIVMVNLINNDL